MKTEASRSTVARSPDGATKPAASKSADGARKASIPRKAREIAIKGIPVSPGVIIGAVFDTSEVPAEAPRREIAASKVEGERQRLAAAVAASRKQVSKLKARLGVLPEEAQEELEPLLDAYAMMLGDSRLIRGARRRIAEELLGAETAVQDEAESIAAAILATKDDDKAGLKRRAGEVREIARRLTRNLTATPFRSLKDVPAGAILVAEELTPADAALLDPTRIAGVATEEGGADGHTAIMLRALGIPSVLGCPGLTEAAVRGDQAVLDGAAGTIVLRPGAEALEVGREALAAYAKEKARLAKLRRLPSITQDGEEVELQANLEIPAELPLIAQAGAQGVGLLRTEFLFMNREDLPDEDAQVTAYTQVVEAMAGDCVTIRVLDWGGEKDMEALAEGIEPFHAGPNPALGLRGIRMLLKKPELLEVQFAAILRVAGTAAPQVTGQGAPAGQIRILLPMVTVPEEVRQAREIYERVGRRLRRKGVPLPEKMPLLGAMIETPGAALAADAIALEADFFAIGTNDLAMYTLAVDRAEAEVAHLYDPLHPAVLRLVQFATEAALRLRMPVSVCGEMAGNPRLVPLLLGLGIRALSMNASAIPRVKQMVRSLKIDDCARFARRVMEQGDPKRIQELVMGFGQDG
ncbi:phosphoenolpyruvate--protein phosphotransferase [Pseudoroseomonas ludipueritiae]|uniref:Phosphoenolpyruvate-protein phosphotransferase n=1 Tax=Pseudoroseomonas ludipueritiae TaxID=198093 RepID=A0ABR7RB90_9PROT|nr:phosphoenolpyruvate--protein phosphotransferase [Pseudoroseomonas ludipueritiae]MBC9179026.1 phosphoenolpyruvate--protein phosphotransferase [Pseudoroseomonas ludipueritiae]MCG7364028.1 phosphoenolpyruvate--protein phosphotransferase [Roseomonas sp. ACRSG]